MNSVAAEPQNQLTAAPKRHKSGLAILSAIVLGGLTISVFGALQDAGPESALRKFHMASVNRDLQGVLDVTLPESNTEYVRYLADSIRQVARTGGRYEVRQVIRRRTQAHALVVYSFPFRNQQIPQIWVLTKQKGKWYVVPDATLQQRAPVQNQSTPIEETMSQAPELN